ncbi:MAG: hypothetical protein JXR73_05335 [Candidatus Omnitrophica bacterium]|nr:hypothetical protein [Candidatus Omnitrophota bacterium]
MKRTMKLVLGMLAAACLAWPNATLAFDPIYRADFNGKTLQESGWAFFQAGPEFETASASIGLIPSSPTSPDFSDGRGVTVTALSGQGSFFYGPVIPANGQLALMRLSVLSLSAGGTIAVGALNADPGGSIAAVNGSASYAYEADSGQFMGDYQFIHVLYRPQNEAVIPLFQLAVNPGDPQISVTAMFDNFEIYLLDEETVSDPALQQILGINLSPPGATPTPTVTPTPTPDQPVEPTLPAGVITTDLLYSITPGDDQLEAFNPSVSHDRDNIYAVAAADLSSGFQDITLRHVDIVKEAADGPYTVNQTFEDTVAQTPDLDVDFSGVRHIVWSDNRSIEKLFSVYLAQLNSFGQRSVDNDFEVNNLFENTNTADPAVSVLDNGNLAVCWRDDRSYYQDVFVRRLFWSGAGVQATDAHDFQVNIPYNNTNASHPGIAMSDNGSIVAVWSDDRVLLDEQKRKDVYARVFNQSTAYDDAYQLPESAPEIQVSAVDSIYDHAVAPCVAWQNGRFVIVWSNQDPQTSDSYIFAAVLNEQGDILQSEFVVDSGLVGIRSTAPSIAAWDNDLFLITWYDDSTRQIVGRVYDALQHLFTGQPAVLVDNADSTEQTAAAVGEMDRSFIVWDALSNNYRDVYGASLTLSGLLATGAATVPPAILQSDAYRKGGVFTSSVKSMRVEGERRSAGRKPARSAADSSSRR